MTVNQMADSKEGEHACISCWSTLGYATSQIIKHIEIMEIILAIQDNIQVQTSHR